MGAVGGHNFTVNVGPQLTDDYSFLDTLFAFNDIIGAFSLGSNLYCADSGTIVGPVSVINPDSTGACNGRVAFLQPFENCLSLNMSPTDSTVIPVIYNTVAYYDTIGIDYDTTTICWLISNNLFQT